MVGGGDKVEGPPRRHPKPSFHSYPEDEGNSNYFGPLPYLRLQNTKSSFFHRQSIPGRFLEAILRRTLEEACYVPGSYILGSLAAFHQE